MRRTSPVLGRSVVAALALAVGLGVGLGARSAAVARSDLRPVRIYLLSTHPTGGGPFAELVSVRRMVDPDGGLAGAALDALIAGPTAAEASGAWPGRSTPLPVLHSRVPVGTVVRGIRVRDGVALVDLGASFRFREDGDDPYGYVDRLAQVTYTLTALPGIDGVRFRKDGKRIDVPEAHEHFPVPAPYAMFRGSYADLLPPVFVDTPAWGAGVGSSVRVTGNATVSDRRIRLTLIDRATGVVLARTILRAPCGGCWQGPGGGSFATTLRLPAGSHATDLRVRAVELTTDGHARKARETPLG